MGRSLSIAGLVASVGRRYAFHRARRLFASVDRREQLATDVQMRTAHDVAERLGHMKGAVMKVGQVLGYLDETVPAAVRGPLLRLQQDAPPMAAELAAQVVEQELGRPPDKVYAVWDARPVAAASIGQVHRAITHDGRAVAVKVQYPGVDRAIHSDLKNVRLLFTAIQVFFPSITVEQVAQELRARVLEELDYRNEAANQRLFAQYYAGHPFISVPDVVDDYCTQRILTTDLAQGVSLSGTADWSQAERDRLGETIFRFVFRSLYQLHAFNGDPHPGNYLCRPHGRVTFLDFGLVRRFDAAEVGAFADIVTTLVLQPDAAGFRRVVEDIGLLHSGAPIDDSAVQVYFDQLYDPVRQDGPHTFRPQYVSGLVRGLFDVRGPHADVIAHLDLPPAFVIVQRITLGLYAVLAQLGATANWRAIAEELWPFTNASSSTTFGRQEALWLSRVHPEVKRTGSDGDIGTWRDRAEGSTA